jgi:hypothetical protein
MEPDSDIDAKRQKLLQPLQFGTTYVGTVARKVKTKSGSRRYYVYDENENLEMAAECHRLGELKFYIALGSTDFSLTDNDRLVAVMSRHKEGGVYTVRLRGAFFENKEDCGGVEGKYLTIEYLSKGQKKGRCSRSLRFSRANGISLEQYDFREKIVEKFPDVALKAIKSTKNFILGWNQEHRISFAKMAKDEFHLAVTGPMCVFDGFCLALSTFFICAYER